MPKNDKTFWVTNISNRNVSLSDLNISIPAFSSVNLLDSKHYHLTEKQLEDSLVKGSLFAKRDKIRKRKVPPISIKENINIDKETVIPDRQHSIYEIKHEEYDSLIVSDDEFAAQNADTVEYDRRPLIPKDKG